MGLNDHVFDLVSDVKFMSGEEVINHVVTGTTLGNGKAVLLNQFQVNGKWRAILLKCSRRYLAEMLPEE